MTGHHTFNFQFFLKKDKASKGTAPLYARIWVDGVPMMILSSMSPL
ncbi:hypothetical protein H8S90_24000 [Olivibacter sp. SDN3]|nr:hypothetical protein [Olivibacter sp. SDN3]QNL49735.1 hypothetical protein H8S90_24000 [Olivibacter sp. SDN3]